jgi:outer membrane protein TolC
MPVAMTMSRASFIVLLTACALGGCASQAIRMPAPAAVPAAWSSGSMMTASWSAVPANAWWQELGDSELDGIVAAALTANADVSIAAARVRQARALADAAAAARRPQLDLGTSACRERSSATPRARTWKSLRSSGPGSGCKPKPATRSICWGDWR